MPKVHKNPVAWRPIVSCTNYVTAGLSQVLAYFLQPIVEKFPCILKDTPALLNDIRTRSFSANYQFATSDVESLYTSIPIWHVIEIFG